MKRQLLASFVCLPCRKVFKRVAHRRAGDHYEALSHRQVCPQCQADLLAVGVAFRAPRLTDAAAWSRAGQLLAAGRRFVPGEAPSPGRARSLPAPATEGADSLFRLPARKRPAKTEPV